MRNQDPGMIILEMNGWRSAVISNSMSMGADQVAGCRQMKGGVAGSSGGSEASGVLGVLGYEYGSTIRKCGDEDENLNLRFVTEFFVALSLCHFVTMCSTGNCDPKEYPGKLYFIYSR
ncbi:hypothetical protein PCH_Pc18g02610 [Penicillium rubens Wisconsin 54-1255]|uniref:Uncharacterized protein n=1 Tax=Penicillium rubens (strain ATCC 28089 / DSM 1075 / NRRL 1951 / Wisconsin 54-1255) TaxID=500485 RepID=B6HCY3_PENRW|nr:hypothetical protein PCH_Pc18g02610 [Penicillium rubens Wisconsin 54-1255]